LQHLLEVRDENGPSLPVGWQLYRPQEPQVFRLFYVLDNHRLLTRGYLFATYEQERPDFARCSPSKMVKAILPVQHRSCANASNSCILWCYFPFPYAHPFSVQE